MRYLCLLAALLLLPVTADAQQEQRRGNGGRRSDRGADNRSSDNRGSGERRSDQRASEQRNSASESRQQNTNTTGLGPIGLPQMLQQNRQLPAWEQKQTPWWERQGPPAWEQQKNGWAQAHPNSLSAQQQNRDRVHNPIAYPPGRYRYGSGYVYLVPSYGYGYPPYALPTYSETYATPPPAEVVTRPIEPPAPPPPPEPPPPPIGVIRLEVEPRDLIQIYVDNVYVGTPADIGSDLGLAPGVRHIELRARGYITHAFDADIVLDRTITYRAQLERDPNAPPPPAPVVRPPTSRTMYVIPGCYVGNVMPTQANLRAGCDMSKLTTIEP